MMQQPEFFKNVRESVVAVQSRATEKFGAVQNRANEKFGAIEGEARKVIDGLVERGRESLPQAKAKVEGFQKRALGFVDTTSREQAVVMADGLRKWAERLEKIAVKGEVETTEGAESGEAEVQA